MKLTQRQAMEAYKVLRKLEYQDMPGEKAFVLFRARKALEPQYQFQDEQERKALDSIGAKINDGGMIEFANADDRDRYIEKIDEIGKVEVEIEMERAKIWIGGLTLNAKDIEALENIADIVC